MDFSIESISDKIHSGRTKNYFGEVLSSYYNENYRSAVVMLWSVCVCDIVYKLQDLVDIYDDHHAKAILKEMSDIQEADSKASSWEVKLIDEVHARTNLLDNAEYENLKYLQVQRHLAAHPVLKNNRELHRPNKDAVRSLIRNSLEDLLTKPPLYARKVVDEILRDLAENEETLDDDNKVRKYLDSKYISRLPDKVRYFVFKDLWKLVFRVSNENCDKHRNINFRALQVIAASIENLGDVIKEDIDFFSHIAVKGYPLDLLLLFLSKKEFSKIFNLLNDDAKMKIEHHKNLSEFGMLAWYLVDSLQKHFDNVTAWLRANNRDIEHEHEGIWGALHDLFDSEEWQIFFQKIISERYGLSPNYNDADFRFQHALKPYISEFDLESLVVLLGKIEDNNQTYNRSASSKDHEAILNRILEIEPDFDLSKYPNFKYTVRRKLVQMVEEF